MSDQPNRIFNVHLVEDESMGADVTSESLDISEAIGYSVEVSWAGGGAPVGSLVLRGSNSGEVFTDISSANVTGNSGSILINVEISRYAFIQLFYDRTSGTATMNAYVNGVRN